MTHIAINLCATETSYQDKSGLKPAGKAAVTEPGRTEREQKIASRVRIDRAKKTPKERTLTWKTRSSRCKQDFDSEETRSTHRPIASLPHREAFGEPIKSRVTSDNTGVSWHTSGRLAESKQSYYPTCALLWFQECGFCYLSSPGDLGDFNFSAQAKSC